MGVNARMIPTETSASAVILSAPRTLRNVERITRARTRAMLRMPVMEKLHARALTSTTVTMINDLRDINRIAPNHIMITFVTGGTRKKAKYAGSLKIDVAL